MTEIVIMALFASSLNLIITYGGLVSFGHAAFFGLGAYGFTLAVRDLGVPPIPALLAGPLLAARAGLLFGPQFDSLNQFIFAMLTLPSPQVTLLVGKGKRLNSSHYVTSLVRSSPENKKK